MKVELVPLFHLCLLMLITLLFQEAAKSYLYDSLWSVSLYKALGDPTRNRKSDLPRILRWGELTIRKRKEQFGRAGDENEKRQSLFFWTCTLSSFKKMLGEETPNK